MQTQKTKTTRPRIPWKPTADWAASTNSVHNASYLYPIQLFARLVPRTLSHLVAVALGTVLAYAMGKTRSVVRHNIEHVGRGRFPSRWMHRAILRTFHNYARYIVDFMCLLWMKPSEIHSVIRHQNGSATFDSLLSQKRGGILVTPHLGHWELGGMLLAADGYPMNVAGLLGDDPWTRRMRDTIRQRLGLRVIELADQTSMYAIIPLIEALRQNEFVAMLTDRGTNARSCTVDFFDSRMVMPSGAALLSFVSRAPILPVFVFLAADGIYRAGHEDPIQPDDYRHLDRDDAVEQITRAVAHAFEKIIARHFTQWYNFYPEWMEDSPTAT